MSDKDLFLRLGRRVKERREARGLSQDDLAFHVGEGVSQSDISRIERGKQGVALNTLIRLADVLDYPLFQLFQPDDKELVSSSTPMAKLAEKLSTQEIALLLHCPRDQLNHVFGLLDGPTKKKRLVIRLGDRKNEGPRRNPKRSSPHLSGDS